MRPGTRAAHENEFWPVTDETLSRKELRNRIGLMNFELTALRVQNADLIARMQRQREELHRLQNGSQP